MQRAINGEYTVALLEIQHSITNTVGMSRGLGLNMFELYSSNVG